MKKIKVLSLCIFISLSSFAQEIEKTLFPPSSKLPCYIKTHYMVHYPSGKMEDLTGTNTSGDTVFAQVYKHISGTGFCTGMIAVVRVVKDGTGWYTGQIYSVSDNKPDRLLGISTNTVSGTSANIRDHEFLYTFDPPVNLDSADFAVAVKFPVYSDSVSRCSIASTLVDCVAKGYEHLSFIAGKTGWRNVGMYEEFNDSIYEDNAFVDLHIYPIVTGDYLSRNNTVNIIPETISIYPNPATSFVTVVSSSKIEELQVFNLIGQMIYKENPNSLLSKLHVSKWDNGNYVIKLITQKGCVTKKIIVTK